MPIRFSTTGRWIHALCFTLFLPLGPSLHGAGVTIITHGFELLLGKPSWVDAMGDYVADRANASGGSASVYQLVIARVDPLNPLDQSVSVESLTLEKGSPPGANANGEIVIKLYWDNVANPESAGSFVVTTKDVAGADFPYLVTGTSLPGLSTALAELPIHLIGHSRGGSLVCELAKLLGERGISVDHVTTLDPHPQCLFGVDADVNVYSNILFADNYYQTLQGFANCATPAPLVSLSGFSVYGAYNRQLTSLEGGYGGLFGAHSDTHLWYHGTLNLDHNASDGEQSVKDAMRGTWYYQSENQGAKTGFYYSRLGGGNRKAGIPEGGTESVGSGYNFGFNRAPLNSAGAWPNVVTLTHDATTPVVVGDTAGIDYAYQDGSNASTNVFYLDKDQNPFNVNSVAVATNVLPTGSLNIHFKWNTTEAPIGTYHLYSKISDRNHTRYRYAPGRITLIAPNSGGSGLTLLPAPSLTSPVNGAGSESPTPTFNWSSVADASSYRIMVATNSTALPTDPTVGTCPDCVVNETPTSPSYSLVNAALVPGRTYYWQVHARSPDYFGTWSSRSSFTTATAAAGSIVSGETKLGEISSIGQTTTYTFTAAANDSVVLKLAQTDGQASLVRTLYGPDGSALASDCCLRTLISEFQVTSTGSYRPGMYSVLVQGNGSRTGPYQLTLTGTTAITPNHAPVLAVPGTQTINKLTTLTVTNSATDVDVPANVLMFSLVSAPTGATINPITGVLTWTPSEAQSPSTNVITVKVSDGGIPLLSDSKSFTVVVIETKPLQLLNPRREGNTFTVSVSTESGKIYVLEFKNSLTDTDWSSLLGIVGDGTMKLFSDNVATRPERYYRVRAQ